MRLNKSSHKHTQGTEEVASIDRLFKIIGLSCKRALYKRTYFAKETYNLKEPTNRSHPITVRLHTMSHRKKHTKRNIIKETHKKGNPTMRAAQASHELS